MKRRVGVALLFLSRFLWVVAAAGTLAYICGCAGLATWLTDAESILPLVGSTITAILAFIAQTTGNALLTSEATSVATVATDTENALQTISTMVAEYNSTHNTTLIGDIVTAVTAVNKNLTAFLADVNVVNVKAGAEIKAFFGLVLSQLTAWASVLPAVTAAAVAGEVVTLTVPLNAKEYKAAFNKILDTPTGDVHVDAALAEIKRL